MNEREAFWLDAERPDPDRYLTTMECGHQRRTVRQVETGDVYPCAECRVLRGVIASTDTREYS